MTSARLSWRTTENPGDGALKIMRHRFASGIGFQVHHHDFAEVFWVEAGTLHHQVNDASQDLTAGDVVFIRPSDRHIGIAGAHGVTLVNASFDPHTVADLPLRYRDVAWPWHDGLLPRRVHLSPRRMERLHAWSDDLASRAQRRIDLECFLLDLTRLVAEPAEHDASAGLPGWLRESLEIFADPRHLPGGTAHLAHLCDRSLAHLNRVVRAAQDRTATDLVNAVRLDWAAAQLRMSDRSIAEVAGACGLPHLGHFYELFQRRFGVTPRRYRQNALQVVA